MYHRYCCNFILQDKSNLLHVLSVSIVYFCNHLQCTHTCFLALVETCLVLCVFKNVICRFLDGKDYRSSLSISNSSSSILHSLSPNLPSRLPFPVLTRRCAHSDCISLWQLHFQYGGESSRIRQILTEPSVKVRPFLFPFTIGKCNLIYSERVKVFFVRICRVFHGSQGQTQSLFLYM